MALMEGDIVGSGRSTRSYQDSLRAIGAWLDVRGYCEVQISERDGALVVEAVGNGRDTVTGDLIKEVHHFDQDGLLRLRQAALSDRTADHAPESLIPLPNITPFRR